MDSNRSSVKLTVAATVAALLAGVAQAGESGDSGALEIIVVTAQKRTEDLQNVPLSLQAIDSRKLDELKIASFDDYLKFLPSVSAQNLGPGQSQLSVRGVTNGGDGLHVGSLPLVGVYLDEMPVTTIANNLDVHIYDVARVEALSGPQGTLFGASSMAGTLRIITNKPDTAGFAAGYTVAVEQVAGGLGGRVEGFVNLPLSDRAAVRLVGFSEHDAGYINNVKGPPQVFPASQIPRVNDALVKSDYNDVTTSGARAALKVDLDDRWTIMPTLMAQQQKTNGQFAYDPTLGDLNVARYYPEENRDRWWTAALTVEGKLSNLDLVYAGSYLRRHVDNQADYSDYSYFYDVAYCNAAYAAYDSTCSADSYGSFFRNNAGNLINPSQTTVSRDQFTKQAHEFRLSTPQDRRARLVTGLFLQRQLNITRNEYRIADLATSLSITGEPGVFYLNAQDRDDQDQAVFGELAFDLKPKLMLTAGARLFHYRNSVYGFFGYNANYGSSGEGLCDLPPDPANSNRPCINIDTVTSKSGETHKLSLTWKFDDQRMLYGALSTGFRPGGVNRVRTRPAYTPDYLTNTEVGWKTSWAGRRVRFNGALFNEEWRDAQFGITGANGITEILNAGKARIRGLETELEWAPSSNLRISAAATWLDPRMLTNVCNFASPSFTCTEPRASDGAENSILAPAGSRLPVSSRFKGDLVVRYQFHAGGFDAHVQGALSTQTDVISALPVADAAAIGSQGGYSGFDLSAGLARNNWSLELYSTNLLDERGLANRFTACSPSVCTKVYDLPIRPRMIGLSFSQKF